MAKSEKSRAHRFFLFLPIGVSMKRTLLISLLLAVSALTTTPHLVSAQQQPATQKPTVKKAQLLYRIQTTDPVVFITIDDGFDKNGDGLDLLKKWNWPVTSFLLPFNSKNHVPYFQHIGRVNDMGTHTAKHTILKGLSLQKQQEAICSGEKQIKQQFGYTTGLFRPPTGSWDATTLEAAANCGISTVLLWRVSMNGSTMTTWGGPPRAGDVILIHYVRSLDKSLKRIAWELHKQGLHVARLADYLPEKTYVPFR
jgi:peptidoglycan/xylan/chitin deacetylase (PgdA/CDA1 family)